MLLNQCSILLCLLNFISVSAIPHIFNANRRRGLAVLQIDENLNPNNVDNVKLVKKLWPPWPFNTLGQKELTEGKLETTLTLPIIEVKTKSILLWAYLRERAKIGTLQLQQGPYTDSTTTFILFKELY